MNSHGGPRADSEPDSELDAEPHSEPDSGPDSGLDTEPGSEAVARSAGEAEPADRPEPADAVRATPPGEGRPEPETTVEVADPDPTVVDLTQAEKPAPPPSEVSAAAPPTPADDPPVSVPPAVLPPVPAYAPPPEDIADDHIDDVDDDIDDDIDDDEADDVDEWAKARRRHRRQTLTFAGSLALVLGVGLLAYLTFMGRIPWPFGGKVNTAVSLCTPSKPLQPKTVTLRVYNGSDRKGLATSVTRQLQAFGFVVEDTGNDPLEAKLKAPIEVRHGDTGGLAARTVAAYLVGNVNDVVDDRQSESVDVVLGPAFSRVKTRKEAAASLAALSASLPPTCPPGVTDGASPTASPSAAKPTSGATKKPAPTPTKK